MVINIKDLIYKLPTEFDRALIRVEPDGIYIYSADRVIDVLRDVNAWDQDTATEFFFYNVAGTVGTGYPEYEWEEDDDRP